MAEAKFYTYIHRRADTGDVFYVGKGTGRRANFILNRNSYWKKLAAKYGFMVEIVAYFYLEKDAFDHERQMIAEQRLAGVRLTNLTEGGEGTVGRIHTDETREKIRKAATGRVASDETRAKLRNIHCGRVFTVEHRAKLSEALRRRFSTPEGLQKAKDCQLKRAFSKEHRAKISAAKKGITTGPHSEASIAKMRAVKMGKKASPETKTKMAASQLARWNAIKKTKSQQ